MRTFYSSNIVAISSAPGKGLRGIVRLSGPDVFFVMEEVFASQKAEKSFQTLQRFSAHQGNLTLSNLPSFPVLLLSMVHPHSYTTEDMVEIHTSSSPLLLDKILQYFFSKGFSLAKAGEFTKRAFLNGRIDLLQAESVLQMIESSSKEELRKGQQCLKGEMGQLLKGFALNFKEILAEINAYIDFPDYDVNPAEKSDFQKKILQIQKKIQTLQSAFQQERSSEEKKIALWGASNVGKSFLFNKIIGENKSIVSKEPYTTRDVISYPISYRKRDLLFFDMACFSQPKNELEKIASNRSQKKLEEVDLILFVLDGRREITLEEKKEIQALKSTSIPILIVLNQREKNNKITVSSLSFQEDFFQIGASSKNGRDMEKLLEKIVALLEKEEVEGEVFFSSRQLEIYGRILRALENALALSVDEVELVAMEIEDALSALGELTGKVVNDEILDLIFSKFCIGK